jgi:hypothetical protein
MSASRRAVLMVATSCAATLALVATVNVSCGMVKVAPACADQCPDLTVLQDRISTLEASVAALRGALDPVVFSAFLETTQNVDTATGTVVALDKAVLDTRNGFDLATHDYSIPVTGEYVIIATVTYLGLDKARANTEIRILRRDGTIVEQAATTTPGNSSGIGFTGIRVTSATSVHLEAGDRVELRAFHDYPTSLNLNTGPRDTHLQIVRIPSAS